MQQFAQISDPHLSSLDGVRAGDLLNKRVLGYISWRQRRRFEHRPEVLAALQRDLRQFRLDQLLVTGDLTHVGLPMEFRQALAWLQTLGGPGDVAVIPGNHDASVAAPWQATFALWRDYMASDTQAAAGQQRLVDLFPSLRVRGDIAFIGLSTACPKPPFMATGTVGQDQLRRLPALLQQARASGQFRVVYLHHSPLQGRDKWRKRLTDAAQVQAIIADHGAELVLNGHGHRSHYDELPINRGKAVFIGIPSASAVGLHGHRPAGYSCYGVERTPDGWRLEISERDYRPEAGEFEAGTSRTVHFKRS